MPVERRRHARFGALVAVVLATSCTSGADTPGEDDAAPADAATPATVTVPPTRLTPFCQAMIDLAEQLDDDPPDDVTATIVATYEAIDEEVPDAIRDDFDAVLATLRGDAPATTDPADETTTTAASIGGEPTVTDGGSLPPGDPYFDERRGPEDDPAGRLAAFVDFECRNVENNPGPPPTQPLTATTAADG